MASTRPTPPPKPSHLASRISGAPGKSSAPNAAPPLPLSPQQQHNPPPRPTKPSITTATAGAPSSAALTAHGSRPVSSAIAGEVPAKPVLAGSVPDNHHPQKSSPQHAVPSSPASGPSTAVSQRKRTVKDFTFGVLLGEGSYSTVVEATEIATNKTYAAKILYKRHIIKEKKTKYVQIERDVLHTLNHPFIVKLYYAFQDRDSLYLVLDLASNGELLTWVRKLGSFPLHCARFYLAEIVTAVEYMHSKGIIHRDLKPENILLGEDMHILITDFGTAFQVLSSGSVSESRSPTPPAPATTHQPGRADSGQASSGSEKRANSFVGTAEYVSPELLKDKAVTKASDVWAIGCIAYQLLAGRPPFKAPNEYLTFQKILRLEYTFPPGFNPQLRDFIEGILVLEPKRRATLEQVKQHAFFGGINFATLTHTAPPRLIPPPTSQQLAPLSRDSNRSTASIGGTGGIGITLPPASVPVVSSIASADPSRPGTANLGQQGVPTLVTDQISQSGAKVRPPPPPPPPLLPPHLSTLSQQQQQQQQGNQYHHLFNRQGVESTRTSIGVGVDADIYNLDTMPPLQHAPPQLSSSSSRHFVSGMLSTTSRLAATTSRGNSNEGGYAAQKPPIMAAAASSSLYPARQPYRDGMSASSQQQQMQQRVPPGTGPSYPHYESAGAHGGGSSFYWESRPTFWSRIKSSVCCCCGSSSSSSG